MIKIKKIVCVSLLWTTFVLGAVVNPSQSTMAILLDASGMCNDSSSDTWKNMAMGDFLKNHAFYGDSNSVYCMSYDASMSPAEAETLFTGDSSVFAKALAKWAQSGKASNSGEKPSRFVIIAEGVAGLAVREYIQSKDYQGEIENVIFFNTPHEGSGFADQSLLNKSSVLNKSKSASDYSDIIPLALAVYLIGGIDILEDLMMSLLKEAVLGMAQNANGIKKNFESYFSTDNYKSLLYLAQDLDLTDNAYNDVKAMAKEKGLDLNNYVGSTQLLNSYSRLNSFDHPAYNNVYSYGLPTIGNGRRTLADFADQAKNHVSKERLQAKLAESVSATLVKNGKEFVPDGLNEVISNAMNGDYAADAMALANDIASKYNIPVSQIYGYVQDVSTLSKLKFNKENLSGSVMKVISIANKYLPEKYKSELFSTFINEYSETLSELRESANSITGDLKKGMDLVSNNLSNYAINFFDEGTFNVPAFSAMGKNVQAFKESSVFRKGYSLKDYVEQNESSYPGLNNYLEKVADAGKLESVRQDIDKGLKIGCEVAEIAGPGAGKICRAAQFIANVTLIANVSKTIEDAVKNVDDLRGVRYAAVKKSMDRAKEYSSWRNHKGDSIGIESSDMESMLFGTPIVSLQTVHRVDGSADSIIPLALYRTFDTVETYDDIVGDSIAYGYSFPTSEFAEIGRNSLTNSTSVMVKDVKYGVKNGFTHKDARYAALGGFMVRNFIEEYRFVIDDFQPDELRLIKFDFNARIQIAYERNGDSVYVYRGKDNTWEDKPILKLSESPVRKDGLFVFRPDDALNKGATSKGDSILLSAIQEDGANSVSIYVVNKVGKANNQRFFFKFQAVDYLLEEGWPISFEKVSRMDTVDFYSNDLGYGATLGKYRLIVSCSNYQDADTVGVMVDSLSGSGARYRFRADLSSVWKKHPLENATYTLKWDLGFKVNNLKSDGTVGEQDVSYSPQTVVWGDTSAPKLIFDTTYAPQVVSFNNGRPFAYVLNLDSMENRSLRGLRGFMVRKKTGEKVMLLHDAYVGEPSYEINGNGKSVSWSDSVDLYVQAYDFANPDSVTRRKLIGMSTDSMWSLVMKNDTAFRSDINGISIHKTILVDNGAPKVTNDSVTALGSVDATLPYFSRQKNGAELVLNAMDTLQVSFDIDEDLLGRDSEAVVVELVFKDSLGSDETRLKRHLFDYTIGMSSKRFVFKEPDINRLDDGTYSLTVSLTDEAGNRSEKRIAEKLRVDRTPPQVRGISLGDVAYENVAELKKGTAHLSQGADDSRNRSNLTCYTKVRVNNRDGKWTGPLAETVSKDATYSNYEFDIRKAASDTAHGHWYVYFGCYDGVGNFGMNMNFMGMGNRYPEITYPAGTDLYSGQILVRGIAPNTEVHGNDNKGEFRVFWKGQGDSTWSEDGFEYLVYDRSLLPSNRDLAVWSPAKLGLAKGSYMLRLSVRSCDTCKWFSDERTVAVDSFVEPVVANSPQIVITPPDGNHVAGHEEDISIKLNNIADTSRWLVKAFIDVPSSQDSSVYVRAVEKTFDPMVFSPYRTPAAASDTGLSIWQENDSDTWHVRYAGKAQGVKIGVSTNDSVTSRMTPYLAIRYIEGNIDWGTSPKSDSTESLGFTMDSIRIKTEGVDMVTTPYNMTKMWNVGTDSVHLVFKTDAPFTVDVASIDSALFRDSLSPVVYIYPENYKAHIVWNGLANGAYSSGSLVKMSVVAYEKGNEKNILNKEESWYLKYDKTRIEFSSNNLEKYYINFLGSSADSSEMRVADYGFQFKLTGRSAFVTAEILDSTDKKVYSLLENERIIATSENQWKTLRWNGLKSDSLVAKVGSYKVHILVQNDSGATVIDTLYLFVMNAGDNILEAKVDSTGRIAELKMDEAFLDSNGKYRYVGRPDYKLRTSVTTTVLPENKRTFNYEWDIYGKQSPVVYQKTRPSLGIRRHRDEFWATVVTLVMGETRDFDGYDPGVGKDYRCKEVFENNEYRYKIQVQKKLFQKGKLVDDITVDLDPINNAHNDWHIYGFMNEWDLDLVKVVLRYRYRLHALAAVKVLPASSYDKIVKRMNHSTSVSYSAIVDAGKSSIAEFPWDYVYQKDVYLRETNMRNWFENWGGQPLYYEAVNRDFKIIDEGTKRLTNYDSLTSVFDETSSTKTSCDTENPLDSILTEDYKKFVCGAKNANEEVDTSVISQFNPHAYMMNVKLVPVEGKSDFVDKNYGEEHCPYAGSGTDIKVRFELEVNPDYWNPPMWGTNNLANRYVRFDPLNKTLYGDKGYLRQITGYNFYNGTDWVTDYSPNNGPTVFEAQGLPMQPIAENPLLFNDEIYAYNPDLVRNDSAIKYYPSEYTWRFYRGNGKVNYKAVAMDKEQKVLATFNSNDDAAKNGEDVRIGTFPAPKDLYFYVAPAMTIDNARDAGIIKEYISKINYPLGDSNCSVDTNSMVGYRFYGCDKWVSHIHKKVGGWNDSLWRSIFALDNGNGYVRNPLTEPNNASNALAAITSPDGGIADRITGQYSVSSNEWNKLTNAWEFKLAKPQSDKDGFWGGTTIGSYVLKSLDGDSDGWETDTSGAQVRVYNVGSVVTDTFVFYRSKDSVLMTAGGLNNGRSSENVPLKNVVAQSSKVADTILYSEWAQNQSVAFVDIYKREMLGGTTPTTHPYLRVNYDDSLQKRFVVNRNASTIYASREDEIVTLRGSVPYNITEWNISYIQNGIRFKVADGTQQPIEASMNVNRLQGNTSFFLTYRGNGSNDVVNYRQLDVHIGDYVKASEGGFVYSMYGNVSVHFGADAWDSDVDVTVRTMDPKECYDCKLFRNMAPVGPVLEVLPSHKFPEGKEPLVTVNISMATVKEQGLDYRNLKIYKLDAEAGIIPLDNEGGPELLDSNLNVCLQKDSEPENCAFVKINAKTPTFSQFVLLDSLKADSVKIAGSIPEEVEAFSCNQMDSIWTDTLWMGSANGWLEFPYLCTGKSNYLLQLSVGGNVSAEHRGASARPIVWPARNTDFYVLDSAYQSSIVFYGVDGNTEQKLGPTVRLDSVAPVIENVDVEVSENDDGSRTVHVEAEIDEIGGGVAQATMELFFGGNLLHSESILGNSLPAYDFKVSRKELFGCVGCKATVKVIVEDKGHNSDNVVKQTEKLYPYPSSLVLWYPFAEGSGKIAYELMTKDNAQRMHMDLATIDNPWNGRYGVYLHKDADSASSRQYKLPVLDSLRPFSFELNYSAGYRQEANWSILSFIGKNEWTFGLGTYSRYFIKVGSEYFYFNATRDANIPTHLVVVVDGKNASLYKNGRFVETIRLASELMYGGNGRLSIGKRNGMRSAVGSISNLRFYSSALTQKQIQDLFTGVLTEETVNTEAVRVVTLADRDGLVVDQSCSAPGMSYLRQNSVDNSGVMTWKVDLKSDNYSLYVLHRNYLHEESKIEVFVNGSSVGIFKLTSTGLWKSEKVAGFDVGLKAGANEIGVRPLGNLGIAALALASTGANIDGNQVSYNESSWTNSEPKAKVLMKYETVDDKKWAQVRFELRNMTDAAFENAKIRYYYKGEGENVNALSFYPSVPMRVVNDAGSVYYAELALTEAIAAYGTAYSGQGPLIGLHRLTSPNNYFPYWDITDDPSYAKGAEAGYVEALGIALVDANGELLNEFVCYDEDGPMLKAKVKVRAMAKDLSDGSNSESNLAVYVENIGNAPVDGFEMRYYFRDTAQTEVDFNWNAFATGNKLNAGGDLFYISFVYDVILNSGDKSDYGSGVQFAIHHPGRTNDFDAADDPSHHNLNSYEMLEADSIVVLDRRGNLLWGYAPQPRFGADYVTKESYADLVRREGDVIYVDIEESDYYTLETVNAIGVPLKTLYKGTWDIGEHSVTVDMNSIQPSSFIVLRKGSEILSWKLLN